MGVQCTSGKSDRGLSCQARRTQLATHEAFKNVAHPATLYAVCPTSPLTIPDLITEDVYPSRLLIPTGRPWRVTMIQYGKDGYAINAIVTALFILLMF